MAWVEWHFAEWSALDSQGRGFTCKGCRPEVQKARKCHEDNWDQPPGGVFPIRLMPNGADFGFCPAKLFRDDPAFVSEMRTLFLAWRTGQMPAGANVDTISEDEAANLITMIMTWESHQRSRDYRFLGKLLGGKE